MNDEDLIHSTRPKSKYKKMSIASRAAQFQPFSALTGYDRNIKELERYVEEKIDLGEFQKEELDEKIKNILEHLKMKPYVTITFFQKDLNKEGGCYKKVSGSILKIDEYKKSLEFTNGKKINFEDIIEIIEREDFNDE